MKRVAMALIILALIGLFFMTRHSGGTRGDVLVCIGKKSLNSSEISKFVGFTPKIPKGWRVVGGKIVVNKGVVILDCERGNSEIVIREGKTPPSVNGSGYIVLDGVRVYTVKVYGQTAVMNVPISYRMGGIWYRFDWGWNWSYGFAVNVIKDMIENPVEFDYKVPMRVEYRIKPKNVERFVERVFDHKAVVPYHVEVYHSFGLLKRTDVSADLFSVYVGKGYLRLMYSMAIHRWCVGNSTTQYPTVTVEEIPNGKIPSQALRVEPGIYALLRAGNTLTPYGIFTEMYGGNGTLLITVKFRTKEIPEIYALKFIKHFISF